MVLYCIDNREVNTGKLREGGLLISKIKQISGRVFDRKLKDYRIDDLNTAQGRIIFSLWKNDNITISELAKQTALGKTTLTSMLKRLQKSEYIVMNEDKKDRRRVIVSLSGKNRIVKARHEAASAEMTSLFYEGLSEKQIDDFENILRHILSNLVRYEEENNGKRCN
jgi:MarR family transcriptional regulator, organic hydroperoxide resistance regulator